MDKRSSTKRPKRPRDINALAAQIVDDATTDEPEEVAHDSEPVEENTSKNPAAVALGRLGGKKGGKARAEKLSPARRQEIARKAAATRWAKKKD